MLIICVSYHIGYGAYDSLHSGRLVSYFGERSYLLQIGHKRNAEELTKSVIQDSTCFCASPIIPSIPRERIEVI